MTGDEQILYEALTEREHEILALIAEGLTNQEIADRLHLTLDTVKWYNRQIYQKLGVRNRTRAVAQARELHLLKTSAPAGRHNLPVPKTDFIGRQAELTEIQALLTEPRCRLLTLIGPGGIGKTWLAIEAAHRQGEHYPDGVHFISLAPIESPMFIAQALADGLGLMRTSQRHPLEQVQNFLQQKTLLLVIDNVEHLLDGIDMLAELLTWSEAIKLLVTSRERLRLKEEWVFNVDGLRYPVADNGEYESVPLTDYEAVRLFMWTARRAVPNFEPNARDLARVGQICELVDGMPLAIELAASWVRLLPVAQIAHEITRGLEIFTTAWRNVPERHRSMQAVLDHSWKLLTTDEQAAFRRLAVFSGSFGREGANAVAGASLALLLSLVDKSLLRQADGDRFDIHDLLKQYGRDKLRHLPEVWAETQLQHCRYHAALLLDRMSAADAIPHLPEIEAVFDDIQAAWRFAISNRLLSEIEQLANGFLTYYRLHSWYRAGSDGLELYYRALTCFDSDTENSDHRATIATLHESTGDLQALATAYGDAISAFENALAGASADDHIRRGRLHGKVADVLVALHRHEQGHQYYTLAKDALEKDTERSVDWWAEWFRIEIQRMELFYWQNRPDDMASLASQLGSLIEQHGSVTHQLRYLYMLGMMALRRDNYFHSKDAVAHTGKALALSLKTGNLGEIAYRYFSYGFSLLWSDYLDEAESHLQIAREMSERNGDLTLLSRALTYLTALFRKRGNTEHVQEYAAYSLRVAREARMPQYEGMAHAEYAWLAWRAGNLAETRRHSQVAIAMWGGLGSAQESIPFHWLVLFPLIGVALQEGAIAQAAEYARRLLVPPQQRLPDELTDVLQRALATWNNNQVDPASDLLRQAMQLARELHYV